VQKAPQRGRFAAFHVAAGELRPRGLRLSRCARRCARPATIGMIVARGRRTAHPITGYRGGPYDGAERAVVRHFRLIARRRACLRARTAPQLPLAAAGPLRVAARGRARSRTGLYRDGPHRTAALGVFRRCDPCDRRVDAPVRCLSSLPSGGFSQRSAWGRGTASATFVAAPARQSSHWPPRGTRTRKRKPACASAVRYIPIDRVPSTSGRRPRVASSSASVTVGDSNP
jgi:hypothetical protein